MQGNVAIKPAATSLNTETITAHPIANLNSEFLKTDFCFYQQKTELQARYKVASFE